MRRRRLLLAAPAVALAGCLDVAHSVVDPTGDVDHESLCDDPAYDLSVGEVVEYDHYGRWELWGIDGENEAARITFSHTADITGHTWHDGEEVEIDGDSYAVAIEDDELRLVAKDGGTAERYAVGDELAYQYLSWTVEAVDAASVDLHRETPVPGHEKVDWARGDDGRVGPDRYVVDVTPDGADRAFVPLRSSVC